MPRPETVPDPSRDLAERYGTRTLPPRARRLLLVAFSVCFLAVVAYVGVRFADREVHAEVVGYEHTAENEVTLTFRLSSRPGTPAHCTVEALDAQRGQVGFTEVDVPAQETSVSMHRVEITTQGPAVSADVVDCEAA